MPFVRKSSQPLKGQCEVGCAVQIGQLKNLIWTGLLLFSFSALVYVLEQEKLVLRASQNPHADLVDHLGVKLGHGINGWVAEHREPVAIPSNASNDPRFMIFRSLPEDHFEAILSTPILRASKVIAEAILLGDELKKGRSATG